MSKQDCYEEEEYTCDTCDCELDPNDLIQGYHDPSVYQCDKCFDNDKEEDEKEWEEEEDYESANCETCDKNYLLDKLEVKDDKFYCRLCYKEDEEFEAQVSNSHLLEVFGDEIVYNKLKELAEQPDLSSTLRVVWKFGDERLSLYVYIDGEPFFDAVYPRNHSCDMFYMLDELKKEQEE